MTTILTPRRAEPTPMRTIQVDSPDGAFLLGRRMIPTYGEAAA